MRTLGEIKPGQTIGRYEFLIPIAEGGMASVWAARMNGTRGFQKTLAIKMMLASLSDNPQFEQMFLDEASIASQIHHPNVVEIFDLGEENDVLYLVMEFVDGEPLSTIFRSAQRKSGMPLGVAVRIVADACAGLHAAHELVDDDGKLVGLVHRDVSPQNILVTYDGNVKIVDFGVAKAEGRSSEKTMAGTVKGKAPYMSPEQALGQEIDRRTDVFAMGIVLYHLTTGKHPFRAENDILTLHNIIEKPPPKPSEVVPNYPKPLEAAVMKALEKSPGKRFQSCAEFEAALDRVLPPTAPRVRPADVGRFVREVVGDRGEKRREALRSAVRLGDERLQNELDAARLAARPVGEIGLTAPVAAVSLTGIRTDLIPTSIDNPRHLLGTTGSHLVPPIDAQSSLTGGTPGSLPSITGIASPGVSTSMPPAATGLPKSVLIAGAAAALLVGVAATMFVMGSGNPQNNASLTGTPTVQPGAEPAATTTSTALAEPAATASAEPAKPEPSSEPEPEASAAVPALDPNQLPAATDPRPTGGGTFVRNTPSTATTDGKKATTTSKDPPPEKVIKKPTGFVPPPINEPGFLFAKAGRQEPDAALHRRPRRALSCQGSVLFCSVSPRCGLAMR